MSDLAKFRADAVAFIEKIKAHPSPEGAHKLTEFAQYAREQARRNKAQRAPLMAFAANLESSAAQLLSVSKAQDDFIDEMGEKWQREHKVRPADDG